MPGVAFGGGDVMKVTTECSKNLNLLTTCYEFGPLRKKSAVSIPGLGAWSLCGASRFSQSLCLLFRRSDFPHSAPIGLELSVSVLLLFRDKSHLWKSGSRRVSLRRFFLPFHSALLEWNAFKFDYSAFFFFCYLQMDNKQTKKKTTPQFL